MVIPHQAGCGGTGPSRHNDPKAETVKRINTSFPHWFCDNFKAFNDDPTKLPFDQNCLVAICAPAAGAVHQRGRRRSGRTRAASSRC